MAFGYPTSGTVLGLKLERSGLGLGLTAIRYVLKLSECLLGAHTSSQMQQKQGNSYGYLKFVIVCLVFNIGVDCKFSAV